MLAIVLFVCIAISTLDPVPLHFLKTVWLIFQYDGFEIQLVLMHINMVASNRTHTVFLVMRRSNSGARTHSMHDITRRRYVTMHKYLQQLAASLSNNASTVIRLSIRMTPPLPTVHALS